MKSRSSDNATNSETPVAASVSGSAPRTSNPYLVDRAELKERLLSYFRSPAYRPPVLPAVALELIGLTRNASASYDNVVRVLEKDPLLVANVLNLAQSSLYGGRPIQSLQGALQRLGTTALRDMVWQIVIKLRIFRAPRYVDALERIQNHGTFTAHLARVVAVAAGTAGEHAFLCGLLHDVGWSGTLVSVSEQFPGASPAPPETLFSVVDSVHTEVGAAMATLWSLAPEIVEVIGHHHDFGRAGIPGNELLHTICVAEQLADECEFAIASKHTEADALPSHCDENIVGRFEDSVAALKLGPKLPQIRTRAVEIAEQLRAARESQAV